MKHMPSSHVARKQERKLEEILRAASDVFTEKGYFAATTRDIADRVRVQPGSLYYYIDSKEAALVEICRRVGAQFTRDMDALLARGDPVDELVREGIRRHMLGNRAHLVFHFAFSPAGLPQAVRMELGRMARAYRRQWENLLARGVREGVLRHDLDPTTAAVALLAMCNGSVEWYQRRSPAAVAAIAATFADCFLRGVVPARPYREPANRSIWFSSTAWAAARRATGTRNGEQET